jgi:glycosyltransferase involved in cell wall biosynthesis
VKVLVVARLFSGLADSLSQGRWEPSGVPAIYKLLEALSRARDIELKLILLCRDSDARFARAQTLKIESFGIEALVLPWRQGLPNALNELRQTFSVLRTIAAWRPQVAYFTNAGFVGAGLAARLRLAPVVLRFLGIFPVHKELAAGRRRLARWFYRAPFAHAVCSQDGSGGEHFLARLLDHKVPLSVLLNGVDTAPIVPRDVDAVRTRFGLDSRPVIAFVGRLVAYKGADEFVDALEQLESLRPNAFQALLVGAGPLRTNLANRISRSALAGRVHFAGAVAHKDVAAHLAASDIYVSLNRNGGLSNANLEALAYGKCVLMLEKDPASRTDVATGEIIPSEIVQRLPRADSAKALAQTLAGLIDRPDEIAARAARTGAFARQGLESWDARIAREIEIIRSAARSSPLTSQAA